MKLLPKAFATFLSLGAVGSTIYSLNGQPRPPAYLIDLRQQTNQIENLISIQVNFLQRSTFDFFNRIDPLRIFGALNRTI